MTDQIKNPQHYKIFPDMEARDIIRAVLTPAEYKGWIKGSALKYRLRAGKKDDVQKDINKAEEFESWLNEK